MKIEDNLFTGGEPKKFTCGASKEQGGSTESPEG